MGLRTSLRFRVQVFVRYDGDAHGHVRVPVVEAVHQGVKHAPERLEVPAHGSRGVDHEARVDTVRGQAHRADRRERGESRGTGV